MKEKHKLKQIYSCGHVGLNLVYRILCAQAVGTVLGDSFSVNS